MNNIVILTATYNHPKELLILANSLLRQNYKEFTWVIVNDGSKTETENVLEEINRLSIDVVILNQDNRGKSKAINSGLTIIGNEVEFVLIVDDDEVLLENAIKQVNEYINQYEQTNCKVIHFNRQNEKGEVIAKPFINVDYYMTYQKHKSSDRFADGYIGYFNKKMACERFSEFENEKYNAPSTLIMKVAHNNEELLWAPVILGQTEYLEGGITKQGRKLRIKNPRGMIEYCSLMQQNGASIKNRVVYSIHGYAYSYFRNSNEKNLKEFGFITACRPFGYFLYRMWRRRYS